MIDILIAVVVAGLVVWLVNSFIPMDAKFKTAFNALVGIFLVLYILQVLGIWSGPKRLNRSDGRRPSRLAAILTALLIALGGTMASAQGTLVVQGASGRRSYIASVSGQATTAAILLSIEADATLGFKLARVCIGTSNATAAALVTVTVRRTTTASSGGTVLTAEGTGTTAVSKTDPTSASFPGIARLGGTPGTAGATLDQFGFSVGEIGAGAADTPSPAPVCVTYGANGSQMPTVAAGVVNGLSINVSAAGAGGLASGSISATIIREPAFW